MKVFIVLCAFALATLCAAEGNEPYRLVIKPKCDVVRETLTKGPFSSDTSTEKFHGNFTIAKTSLGSLLTRPDLYTPQNRDVVFVSTIYGNCGASPMTPSPLDTSGSLVVWKFREEATYNKHKCFRYYNDTRMSMWIDKDNIVWGTYVRDEDTQSWINYSYPKKHSPSTFVLDESSGCGQYPDVLKAPNDTFFYGVCAGGSALYPLCSLFLMVASLLFFLLL